MADYDEDEDEYADSGSSGKFTAALSRLPPRVALAYLSLQDPAMPSKHVKAAAQSLVIQYLNGEFSDVE